ncbi:hypothetical protein VTN00DRAFT_1957 [Thermoascus crustaceus]|uniref:uncharacterized protein n=1 Tax=Thermoascus crustaceus TaxID=5088 RepID=UPI003742131D
MHLLPITFKKCEIQVQTELGSLPAAVVCVFVGFVRLPPARRTMEQAVRGVKPDPQYQLQTRFYIKESQNSEAKCERPTDHTGFSPIASALTSLLIGEARTKRTEK